jgi:hypothetical protein
MKPLLKTQAPKSAEKAPTTTHVLLRESINSEIAVAVMKNIETPNTQHPIRCTIGASGLPLKKRTSTPRLFRNASGHVRLRCFPSTSEIHMFWSSPLFGALRFPLVMGELYRNALVL